jgi:hypothetical protein
LRVLHQIGERYTILPELLDVSIANAAIGDEIAPIYFCTPGHFGSVRVKITKYPGH